MMWLPVGVQQLYTLGKLFTNHAGVVKQEIICYQCKNQEGNGSRLV